MCNTTNIQIPLPKEMKNANYGKHAYQQLLWICGSDYSLTKT